VSQRVIAYEGEGRKRRPVYADEGGSSPVANDPMAMYGRLSVPGLVPGLVPTGGAGPIEKRQITEAERAIRQEARPSPIAPRPPPVVTSVQEEPVSELAQEPAHDMTTPATEPLDALSDLAEAVVMAIEARDAKAVADEAWEIAQRALAAAWRAMPPLDLPDDAPRLPKPVIPPEPAPVAPVRPSADGGRATAEQLQASRRNGQAAMQAQRRAVELTSAAAAKATTRKGNGGRTAGQTRTPEQRETMRVAQLASIARRKAAKPAEATA
jgi:hypothetical protein